MLFRLLDVLVVAMEEPIAPLGVFRLLLVVIDAEPGDEPSEDEYELTFSRLLFDSVLFSLDDSFSLVVFVASSLLVGLFIVFRSAMYPIHVTYIEYSKRADRQ